MDVVWGWGRLAFGGRSSPLLELGRHAITHQLTGWHSNPFASVSSSPQLVICWHPKITESWVVSRAKETTSLNWRCPWNVSPCCGCLQRHNWGNLWDTKWAIPLIPVCGLAASVSLLTGQREKRRGKFYCRSTRLCWIRNILSLVLFSAGERGSWILSLFQYVTTW